MPPNIFDSFLDPLQHILSSWELVAVATVIYRAYFFQQLLRLEQESVLPVDSNVHAGGYRTGMVQLASFRAALHIAEHSGHAVGIPLRKIVGVAENQSALPWDTPFSSQNLFFFFFFLNPEFAWAVDLGSYLLGSC